MDHLQAELSLSDNWKGLLRSSCKMNKLRTSLAGQLTPSKLAFLRERFTKAYEHDQQTFFESWIEHQMRAFHWILIALSALKNVRIEDFGPGQWQSLYNIFPKKSPAFLRYETKRFLVQKATKNKNWAPDENEVLKDIAQKYDSEKIVWNEVARKLFEESGEKYFRSAKHCREHWQNYLDPSKQRGQWTAEEELQLLEKVLEEGKKWAEIGKVLNRTDHCVKNKFNSIISKQKKKTPNISKEEKIIAEARKSLKESLQIQVVASPEPKITIKLSTDSQVDENRLFNRDPSLTFQEMEAKNSPGGLPTLIEGEQFVRDLLRDGEGMNRSEGSCLPSFWANSPKNLTPFRLSPSPLSLNYSNYGMSFYMHNFNMQLQKQQKERQAGPH